MSLRQLKFKPKLQRNNVTAAIPSRVKVTELNKAQNESNNTETELPSTRTPNCEQYIDLIETDSLVGPLNNEKNSSTSSKVTNDKLLTDELNIQNDTSTTTKLKDTFGVSLRQLKFKPRLQIKKPFSNEDVSDKKQNLVELPSPKEELSDKLLISADSNIRVPIANVHLNDRYDCPDSQLKIVEKHQFENDILSSKKSDKSTLDLQKLDGPEVECNKVLNNHEIHSEDKIIVKPQLTHRHHKIRLKLDGSHNKIISPDSYPPENIYVLREKDGCPFQSLSPSVSKVYDSTKKDIQVSDEHVFSKGATKYLISEITNKYLHNLEEKLCSYNDAAVSEKTDEEISTSLPNKKNVQLSDKSGIVTENLIDCAESDVSHSCEKSRLLVKDFDLNKEQDKSEESSNLSFSSKPSNQSFPPITELFDLTKGDTGDVDEPINKLNKGQTLNPPRIHTLASFDEKKENLSATDKRNTNSVEDRLKLFPRHMKFKPKLNRPARLNTPQNCYNSKQILGTKEEQTADEKESNFKNSIVDCKDKHSEHVKQSPGLGLISPRLMNQRKGRIKLSISAIKENELICLQKHEKTEKITKSNESSSDSVELNNQTLSKNELDIDSVKPVQTSNQKVPFKPKLDYRKKKKFSSSPLGKFYSEAKQKFTKKFRNQVPDSSRLTMLDLIFYNPASNPMPQPERRRVEEPSTLDNSDSDDIEKDLSTDSNKNDLSESNDNNEVPVPQLKLSADGKIVIAQESLVIKQSLGEISNDIEVITDNEPKKKKKKRKDKDQHRQAWSHEDTLKFYKALNSLGSDFETMKSVFPERSRGNLKSKFKKEEKIHGDLIDKVMSQHCEFNIEDVLDELEVEKRLADATAGRGIYVCKNTKDHQNTINRKRKKKASSLSAKEITGIIKTNNKKHIDENVQDCEIEEDSTLVNDNKRIRVDYKRPTRHITKLLQILKQKNWPSEEEIETDVSTTIIPSDVDEKNDHIVISTNIEYEKVKYTQYISYNSNNLENPIEINETISHD